LPSPIPSTITVTISFLINKMSVFVTGAAGFIGRAVTQELLQIGHEVLGQVRSDALVEIITKLGADVLKI
jgi:NADP-dependent 3-hydroxy acid dehydrogenase YdfG